MKTIGTSVTKHGATRIKQRCGVGKSRANRICELAATRGTHRTNTKGSLRRWLDKAYAKSTRGEDLIVWGDKAYIFSRQMTLITVLQIPQSITKNINKMLVAT